jgi:hypothetical protein
MNDLLKLAIDGHGGMHRWEQISRISRGQHRYPTAVTTVQTTPIHSTGPAAVWNREDRWSRHPDPFADSVGCHRISSHATLMIAMTTPNGASSANIAVSQDTPVAGNRCMMRFTRAL